MERAKEVEKAKGKEKGASIVATLNIMPGIAPTQRERAKEAKVRVQMFNATIAKDMATFQGTAQPPREKGKERGSTALKIKANGGKETLQMKARRTPKEQIWEVQCRRESIQYPVMLKMGGMSK